MSIQRIGKPSAENIKLATLAFVGDDHKTDIRRDIPDFAIITGKAADGCYKGRWLEGFGFINVHFPAEGVREMTAGRESITRRGGATLVASQTSKIGVR